MSLPRAIIRCDASPSIGGGHVTRCLALAEALRDADWAVGFVVGADAGSTVPALQVSGFRVRELVAGECELEAMRWQAPDGADLVVIDHYQRDRQFEHECRAFARKILVFDDINNRAHDCDVLVDAAAADTTLYAQYLPTHAVVLNGPAYAVIRKSFVQCRDKALARRDGRPVRSILVSCGATDPANCTESALMALEAVDRDVDVIVALSSRAPHLCAVRGRLRNRTRLELDVDADRMAELMSDADLAIGAPGATAFERAALGLPTILVTFAENQRAIARMMVRAGAAADAGDNDGSIVARIGVLIRDFIGDADARRCAAQAASTLVDGQGPSRIAQAIG